jgi:hypothetical protein
MIITRTITKKILENLVHQTFSKFGVISSSSLLDSLKLLGFHYATNAGISINIEDLKTPDLKKNYIKTANNEIVDISKLWQQGFVSDTERFQTIIDSWNIATESLKNRIVEYYQNYDPANNLYIMAFSGARGNMSQVRQLVGMRGLMSDQEGKIIDLPIQTNFREGLSSIDYIISSYGARKGIVDTALKTADSGYLTRRLIYVAQDLIIREKDCKTKKGIIFLLNKNTNIKNIVGRTLIFSSVPFQESFVPSNKEQEQEREASSSKTETNTILTEEMLEKFKKNVPVMLNLRSSLTCSSNGSICQNCYGWNLAHGKIISLGEAVGIIAAQSIGEPGTQLTMRTFHTGGIFTGELVKQITANFSGKLIIPSELKTISYRTNHGVLVSKLQQETTLSLIDWKGNSKQIFLEIGSYLYISSSSFIRKGQLIAEYNTQTILPGARKLKPIYSSLAGEIRFENLLVRKMLREKRVLKVNQDDGVLWIAAGKVICIPKETEYLYPKNLDTKKPLFRLKLVSPYQGIINFSENNLAITSFEKQFSLNLIELKKLFKNSIIKFSILVKNYQYIDRYTILGYLNFFPIYEGTIYSARKKESKYLRTVLLITESDVWKINSDQVNNFSFFQDKKTVVRTGNLINSNLKLNNSGFFLKKDGFKMIFQNAIPIFLSRGTILKYNQGDFILEKKVIATLVNYTQQTEDIVQGLPKIEELIEARKPKIKAYLASRPGIFLNSTFLQNIELNSFQRILQEHFIKCIYTGIKIPQKSRSKRKKEKQVLYLVHNISLKDNITLFNNNIFKISLIPSTFLPTKKHIEEKENEPTKKNVKENEPTKKNVKENEFLFKNLEGKNLEINGKVSLSTWNLEINPFENNQDLKVYNYTKNKICSYLTLNKEKDCVFKNKREDFILLTNEMGYIFLEYLNPILEYELPLTSKIIFEPGNFIDIGEPMTEGMIDIHELLQIFFKYHIMLDGVMEGTNRSLIKFQLLLVNSIQSIYQSQGVNISSKHIEIIVKQMTSKVVIKESGDTPLLPGELIRFSLMTEIYKTLLQTETSLPYKIPKFEPILRSATNSSLSKDGFLSSAGFQETKRVLTKAAIEGSSDWLRGLKECIIIGRLIPAGSSFLNYKNYLDNIYLFKNELKNNDEKK